jgi:hypothetical protein
MALIRTEIDPSLQDDDGSWEVASEEREPRHPSGNGQVCEGLKVGTERSAEIRSGNL